jgi:glycosyltransferase involved in cell wall biosynthesis
MDARRPRVVLVHDWLTGMRGGEKCLERLCRRWQNAPLMTLLHAAGSVSPDIEELRIRTSFLQRLPGSERYYRYLLPLLPVAARWPIPPCDLVFSLSHCVAKAARPPRGVPHVCYCFTPMRYAWHMRDAYFGRGRLGQLPSALVGQLLRWLRHWDLTTATRVTHFIAISETIRERIAECYDRESTVIYPPVDTEFYTPAAVPREDYYLVVSAFAPYKRIDLAVRACTKTMRKIVVIGTGQDERRLRALAGPTVTFLGWQPDETIREHFRRCRALLFPGEEDFGIVPVEAQACGAPVIAFGRGGATETVVPPGGKHEPTGFLFREQSSECLSDAMDWFERHTAEYSPFAARKQAVHFNPRRFDEEIGRFVDGLGIRRVAASRRAA